jgi:hypothetical protein
MNNEPVAWMWSEDGCNLAVCLEQDKQIGKQEFQNYDIPLYTHPAKTLTDEEIANFEWAIKNVLNFSQSEKVVGLDNVIRAILRKAQKK